MVITVVMAPMSHLITAPEEMDITITIGQFRAMLIHIPVNLEQRAVGRSMGNGIT